MPSISNPHRDEVIKNNASVFRYIVAMVEALDRKVATADDYRRYVGIDSVKETEVWPI